jgi:hypothetical protein
LSRRSPSLCTSVHLDRGFADHRLVDDCVPPIDLSVFWPTIAIATDRGTPSRSRFLIAVLRKSCGTRATPADLTARCHAL